MEEQNTENAEKEVSVKEENTPANSGENTETQNAATETEEIAAVEAEKEDSTTVNEDVAKENKESESDKIKSEKIYPDVVPGANVKIYQKIKEQKGKEEKERIQIFEGLVLARKGGSSIGATITVQKICKGGFEVKKIFPLHLPTISKIEVGRKAKVRKAKLSFLKKTYKKKLKY